MILHTIKHPLSARGLLLLFSSLAAIGLFVPSSPAYLPSLWRHYSNSYAGHSLGYWVRAVDGADDEVRRKAIFALGSMGEDAAESVPSLARIVREDANVNARIQASLALAKIGPAATSALPGLARSLDEDESPQVRMNCVIALSRMGSQARPAVAVLIRALQRRANRTNLATFAFTIQGMAAFVLGRATVGTTEGVAALIEALESAHTSSKRCLVAQALGEIGPPARPAVPLLLSLLDDQTPEVGACARESLRKIRGE
ncbi:MAG: HEAT repeat domain-containing protein [Gemmataceae bacterium]